MQSKLECILILKSACKLLLYQVLTFMDHSTNLHSKLTADGDGAVPDWLVRVFVDVTSP